MVDFDEYLEEGSKWTCFTHEELIEGWNEFYLRQPDFFKYPRHLLSWLLIYFDKPR